MAVEKIDALEQESASGLVQDTDIELLPSSKPSGPPRPLKSCAGLTSRIRIAHARL